MTLDQADSPTFIGIRQKDFDAKISCEITLELGGEAGITLYMDENHHYEIKMAITEIIYFNVFKSPTPIMINSCLILYYSARLRGRVQRSCCLGSLQVDRTPDLIAANDEVR